MTDNKNSLEQFKQELEEDIQNFEKNLSALPQGSNKDHTKRSHNDSSTNYAKLNSGHHDGFNSQSSSSHSKQTSHSKNSHPPHHRKKRKKWSRVLYTILIVAVLLVAAGYGFLHWELNRIQRNTENEITDTEVKDNIDIKDEFGLGKADADLLNDPNITNLLLIGQDRREGQKAEMRSDAMIICSINSKTSEIILTSLMRDMYLPIPGYGYGLLNSTYLIGGFDLLNKTIEKNFGVEIDGDLEVDFNRFYQLMAMLDGLELNLSQEEANYLNNNSNSSWSNMSGVNETGWTLKEGVNKMTPEQITLYCRMRQNVGGDWGRTDRQRKVVMSCFNKLKNSGAKSILSFAHHAMPLLTTNMTNTSIIKLAYVAASYKMDATQSYRLPYEGSYTQEIKEDTLHVLVPDIEKNKRAAQQHIYDFST